MYKKAYSAKMTFEVPDSEKRVAEKADESFEDLIGLLRYATNHLNLIYEPFESLQSLDNEMLKTHSSLFKRYQKAIEHNYKLIFKKANQCAILMGTFSTDTKTKILMNSFLAYIHELEKQVERLIRIFDNLDSSEFKNSLILAIDFVKKTNSQLKQLVGDRILDHIDTNILAKNWVNNVTDDDDQRVYDKAPLLVQLREERVNALKGDEV
jgi:hypothetical protein